MIDVRYTKGKHMTGENYGVGELIHNGDLYDYMNNFNFNFDFYKKWALQAGGSVLELCSGTGRLTIPLKQTGIDIIGLDISDSMRDKAQEKSCKLNLKIDFIKGDIRDFNLGRKFSLIFVPFNSLQNIYSIQDVEKVFTQVKKHLQKDGLFIFDIFNPNFHYMLNKEQSFMEQCRFTRDDGVEVIISEKCKYDAAGQVNRVQWLHKIGGEEFLEKLDMRCFYPLEMDALLKYNNFEVVGKFGDFEEKSFESESAKQIYVCKITNRKT